MKKGFRRIFDDAMLKILPTHMQMLVVGGQEDVIRGTGGAREVYLRGGNLVENCGQKRKFRGSSETQLPHMESYGGVLRPYGKAVGFCAYEGYSLYRSARFATFELHLSTLRAIILKKTISRPLEST